ncbi:MAG: ATP synthase F1 subunit gamma [Bacteroidota bacterium]|nr:ATP synthase F1 subunit gamma [Bacteroidota bacterium]|tara:strand:+ start:652 stop:1515 length:864 start_codon:yes stop_codon:yes gene_type:complete
MSGLKEIRNRISSVSSTMQITNAMKMVSAAKLKKAQDSISATLPYSNKLSGLIQNISTSGESLDSPFFTKRTINKVLIVAITSNKGLCGGFNSNVIKEVSKLIETKYSSNKAEIICIGKKGRDVLSKKNKVIDSFNSVYDDFSYENVKKIAELFMEKFSDESYDEIMLVYNHSKNAATQILTVEPYLPIEENNDEVTSQAKGDYIFEPSQSEILNELIPKALIVQLFKAISDSIAGEHGARMTAMHKATDNASELRDQLKLTYNKARQTAITNEILEIVGGAEALNS